jgi:hypothetical protein
MTNPYFPPEEFLNALGAKLQDLIKGYPSPNWHISSLLAKSLRLARQELIVANGASELTSTITSRGLGPAHGDPVHGVRQLRGAPRRPSGRLALEHVAAESEKHSEETVVVNR